MNPTVYTAAEFSKRQESALVTRVFSDRLEGLALGGVLPLERAREPLEVDVALLLVVQVDGEQDIVKSRQEAAADKQ